MKLFDTANAENLRTRIKRLFFNCLPVYIGTRARLKFISTDMKEVHILLPLNFFTRNIAGTVFGGSIYSSVDPIYMFMLIHILGVDYVVWDKGAEVKFIRPARTSLKARLLVSDEMIERIKKETAANGESVVDFLVEYVDNNQQVCASIKKMVYVARKDFYINKRIEKGQPSDYKLRKW